jgi:hypothetical protein
MLLVQSPPDSNHIDRRFKASFLRRRLRIPAAGGGRAPRNRFQAESTSAFVIWTFAARAPMS